MHKLTSNYSNLSRTKMYTLAKLTPKMYKAIFTPSVRGLVKKKILSFFITIFFSLVRVSTIINFRQLIIFQQHNILKCYINA